MIEPIILAVVLCGAVTPAYVAGVVHGHMRTELLITRPWDWSIGIYSGSSLETLNPLNGGTNPVLNARGVSDLSAEMVADPL